MNPQVISFIDNYLRTTIQNVGFYQQLSANNWNNQWMAALSGCQDANQLTAAINQLYQSYLQQTQQQRQQQVPLYQQNPGQFNTIQFPAAPQFQGGVGFQQVPQPQQAFSRLHTAAAQSPQQQPMAPNSAITAADAEMLQMLKKFIAAGGVLNATQPQSLSQQMASRQYNNTPDTSTLSRSPQTRGVNISGPVTQTVQQQDVFYDTFSYDGILTALITRVGVLDKVVVSKARLRMDTTTSGEETDEITLADLQLVTNQDVSPNESTSLMLDRMTEVYQALANARHWINPTLNGMATSFVNANNALFCSDGTVITDLSSDGCDLIELVNRNSTDTKQLPNLLTVLDAAAIAFYTICGSNENTTIVDVPNAPTEESPSMEDITNIIYTRELECLVYYKHRMTDEDLSVIVTEHSKLFDKPNWYSKLNAIEYTPYHALVCSSSGVELLTLAKTETGIVSSLQQLLTP